LHTWRCTWLLAGTRSPHRLDARRTGEAPALGQRSAPQKRISGSLNGDRLALDEVTELRELPIGDQHWQRPHKPRRRTE